MRLLIVGCLLLAGVLGGACSTVDAQLKCATDDDCLEGYACDIDSTKVCLRQCGDQSDCLALQFCDIPAGQTAGYCRDGNSSADGGDTDPGDPAPAD
jgi:hypothetical protein